MSPQISASQFHLPVDCTSGPLHRCFLCFLCLPALRHFYWILLIFYTSQSRPCLLGRPPYRLGFFSYPTDHHLPHISLSHTLSLFVYTHYITSLSALGILSRKFPHQFLTHQRGFSEHTSYFRGPTEEQLAGPRVVLTVPS